jgi:hypothetical protein
MKPLTKEKKEDLVEELDRLDHEELIDAKVYNLLNNINEVSDQLAAMYSELWSCKCGHCRPQSYLNLAVGEKAAEFLKKFVPPSLLAAPVSKGCVLVGVFKPGEFLDDLQTSLGLPEDYSAVDRFHFSIYSQNRADHLLVLNGLANILESLPTFE